MEEILKYQSMIDQLTQLIKNPALKADTAQMLKKVPAYFWTIPASSTGKYHPTYTLGESGLFRHTLAAQKAAIDLFGIYNFSEDEKDLILCALALHDCCKKGIVESPHTIFDHPIVAAEFVKTNSQNQLIQIMVPTLISSHMGQFNTSKYSKVVLPTPNSEMARFVHLCDYLASRKDITFDLT